ncbi:MAG: alpha/beta hydrolase [Candidatus Zixiibacteriota bacterium]|nr:MAG: alpha/beta hydrolase [candidate division Zixibacteria bacterium]
MKQVIALLTLTLVVACSETDDVANDRPETAVRSGVAIVEGTELYYEELGEGHPVVLIHGGGLDRRMWDAQLEPFAEHYRVIRYDVRKHGRTKGTSSEYTDHGELHGLLEHLGVEKAVIVGHSMGGRIAVDFALKYPDMTAGLVLDGPGIGGVIPDTDLIRRYLSELSEALEQGDLERSAEVMLRYLTDGPQRTPEQVDSTIREQVRTMYLSNLGQDADSGQAYMLSPPAIGRLSEVSVPTLVIEGDLDMPEIIDLVDVVTREIPDARRVTITGAAHMVNMEKVEEFNQVVLDFLARLKLDESR